MIKTRPKTKTKRMIMMMITKVIKKMTDYYYYLYFLARRQHQPESVEVKSNELSAFKIRGNPSWSSKPSSLVRESNQDTVESLGAHHLNGKPGNSG